VPPRAGLTETVILRAAGDLADEKGLEAVSLAALAERLRVQAPSLYNHIAGVEGVQRGLAAHGAEQLANRLVRATVGKSGEQAVYALGDAYRLFAKEHPGLYAATLRAPKKDESAYVAAAEVILEVVGASLEPYRLNRRDLIDAVRGLRSLVHGFVTLELSGGFGMPQDVNRSFREVLRTYLAGVERKRGGGRMASK
jgi:AcrR family transcriptional regulator